MGARDARGNIDGAARRSVRRKAWELARSPLFTPDERDDLQQEMLLDLLIRLPRFDPNRGSLAAFTRMVVKKRAATLKEHRRAERRNPKREAFSLDQVVADAEGRIRQREEEVGAEHLDASQRRATVDHDLRVDLGRAIYALPPHLARLAHRLMTQSITEISRATGIPRGTLYEAVARIRTEFENAGLGAYLSRPTHSPPTRYQDRGSTHDGR